MSETIYNNLKGITDVTGLCFALSGRKGGAIEPVK
jgi:hypothetical protein